MSQYEDVCVPVPTELFIKLAQFLKEQEDRRNPVLAVHDAIDYWMDNASWKPELIAQRSEFASRGYTWKYDERCLFLPHGTEIRMPHKGKNYYAAIEGDQFTYDGKSMSPGSFANLIAHGSRNAWICLWVKRPADSEWKLVDHLSPSAKSKAQAQRADRMLDELANTGHENPSAN